MVSIKYLTFVMRADNAGEGDPDVDVACRAQYVGANHINAGDYGANRRQLFYGEVVITPAISVMSAIEGLEIVAPQLDTDSSSLNYRSHFIIYDSKAWHGYGR